MFLVAEPYCPIPIGYLEDVGEVSARIRSGVRPLIYRLYGYLFARRLAGVFAISRLAIRQYLWMGVAESQVIPFGYFVPSATPNDVRREQPEPSGNGCLRAVYVGTLIRRKGIGDLVDAFTTLVIFRRS